MRIVLLLFLQLMANILAAQNPVYQQPVSSPADHAVYSILSRNVGTSFSNTWNVGSAKKLEGTTYLLEVWLTSPGTAWNYGEMGAIQAEINSAADWLTRKAAEYGKRAEFRIGCYAGDGYRGVPISGLPRSYAEACNSGNLLVRALQQIGYPGMMECYHQLRYQLGCDNVLVLVVINNEGWSCANSFSTAHASGGYESYFLENAFIFATVDGEPPLASTIAHEMLHLFGAWDMYAPQVSDYAQSYAQACYPGEIMLTLSRDIDTQQISPLTAWLTGLSGIYSGWYMDFKRIEQY